MFLTKTVFVVFTFSSLINNVFALGKAKENPDEVVEEQTEEPPQENHTFVALIDILFTNERKHSCTGTIIHDNVVVTTANCFVDENPFVLPELTASFVVIGTKNMFDSGYENYLPIERVITHPKYKGWTANLALVYTFAGMTSDKPGSIIPLNEAGTTPVDSNVTVLSWGHCKDIEPSTLTRAPLANSDPNPDSKCDPQDSNSCDDKIPRRNGMYVKMKAPVDLSSEERQGDSEFDRVTAIPAWRSGPQLASSDINHRSHYERPDKSIPAQKNWNLTLRARVMLVTSKANKRLSRYLPSKDNGRNNKRKNTQKHSTQRHRYYKSKRNKKSDEDEGSAMLRADVHAESSDNYHNNSNNFWDLTRMKRRRFEEPHDGHLKTQTRKKETKMQSYYKDWRRNAGATVNKLTVEIFGFVNVQTCKKMVEKALPALYSINPNYVVCYSTEEHYITDEDAGAPAINQEQLVAVTMGGVLCEGDHVAVGIKMSCFCTWIAENLPDGGKNMNCCRDCCQSGEGEDTRHFRHSKHKNKYLY